MKLSAYYPAHTDEFGEHKECNSEWEPQIPVGLGDNSYCFVITERFGKYIVKECHAVSYWFTGIWGWKMSNGWCISADEYGETIFGHDELQMAIEICEKKNRMQKVKVVRMW